MLKTNRTKTFFVILMIFMFSILVLGVTPARAGITIIVDTNVDVVDANGDCSLREAITAANTNASVDGCTHDNSGGTDTITFAGNYTITLSSTLPEIFTDMTIIGNGTGNTIIRASACDPTVAACGHAYRIVRVNGSVFGLSDITIKHGNNTGGSGGGLQIMGGSDATLDNVIVEKNVSRFGGGGIEHADGTLMIKNGSIIRSNTSGNNGGGIYTEGTATVTIKNSTVSDNTGDSTAGGIFVYDDSHLVLDNSTVSGNKAKWGGGIQLESTGSMEAKNGSLIDNNQATTQDGGGIHIRDDAGAVVIDNSTISNNTAAGGGGGIYNDQGQLTIKNGSIIDNNTSNGTDGGGGIFFIGKSAGEFTRISDSTISNNKITASGYGAGVNASSDGTADGELTITDTKIFGNITVSSGGGVAAYAPTTTITNSAIFNNTASNDGGVGAWAETTLINTTISGNTATGSGAGGIGFESGTYAMYNVTITNNNGTNGGMDLSASVTLNIYNSIIAGNNGTINKDCETHISATLDFNNEPGILQDPSGCTLTNGGAVTNVDPLLAALANNGGDTKTHALLAGSPAINAATGANATATDQRGEPAVGVRDLGAYEYGVVVKGSPSNNTGAVGGIYKVNGVWFNIPEGAIPSSRDADSFACRIIVEEAGMAADYGFSIDEVVWDIKVFCDGKQVHDFEIPITICVKPSDGSNLNKTLFHRHGGLTTFSGLPNASGKSGWVCGTTSQLSLFLAGEYLLPQTGFAPETVTELAAQPSELAYTSTEIVLNIPKLGITQTIVGVPQSADGWNVNWLGNGVGYLSGTAFPTWAGNTALTGHVWNADGSPGVFYGLDQLQHGDRFTIEAWGLTYTYEVRESEQVYATNLSVLDHSDYDVVTLITCEGYSEWSESYGYRRAVTAVLVQISE